ncbi:hypothetical protein EV44_g3464 [Erysiphe necator]|uniref:Uncharacterized protein n=1 Tax=Uncinula necator TaxID=52586 RepID=A0A0B1P0K5_UNCNE|nr:hypothetical protein EV44_g3464 [Erysiphe necator]
MDETPDNPYYSKEDGTAKFQPAGLGSFHLTRQTMAENTSQQDLVTHPIMLAELTRMYEALVYKIVMENGALLTAVRVGNQKLKNDVDQLRQEEMNRDIPETQIGNANGKIPDSLPSRPTMASMTAKNAPTTIKPANWTTLASKKGQKNYDNSNSITPPLEECGRSKATSGFLTLTGCTRCFKNKLHRAYYSP